MRLVAMGMAGKRLKYDDLDADDKLDSADVRFVEFFSDGNWKRLFDS